MIFDLVEGVKEKERLDSPTNKDMRERERKKNSFPAGKSKGLRSLQSKSDFISNKEEISLLSSSFFFSSFFKIRRKRKRIEKRKRVRNQRLRTENDVRDERIDVFSFHRLLESNE